LILFIYRAPYAAHGYGGFFTTALLDRHFRKDLTREEAYELMKDCVREIQKRLVINLPNFEVRIVDKSGVSNMPDISVKTLEKSG